MRRPFLRTMVSAKTAAGSHMVSSKRSGGSANQRACAASKMVKGVDRRITSFYSSAAHAALMSLFRIAEYDYTRGVKLRPTSVQSCCCIVLLASCVFALPGALCATESRDRDPHQLYAALNSATVDPATVYRVAAENRISLHRGDATLQFDEGKLA